MTLHEAYVIFTCNSLVNIMSSADRVGISKAPFVYISISKILDPSNFF